MIRSEVTSAGFSTGEETFINVSTNTLEPLQLTEVQYNLMDANADGTVDIKDTFVMMYSYTKGVFTHNPYFTGEGRYDLQV